ncbi:hypothetical protein HMPREF0992_00142 [Lachnospiraceae bacterium 6_1_63FAA]|nr:hypothetical protein HMPREF0992_00142 [Lachnospiraceae bacterium 6_1_63FAA]
MVKYQNSIGEIYSLQEFGVKIKNAKLHSYSWNVIERKHRFGAAVRDFKKDAIEYKIELRISGTDNRKKEIENILFEAFERDINTKRPGKLLYDDYYIECYITASETSPDEYFGLKKTITAYCPYPFWIKETTYQYLPEPPEAVKYTELEEGIMFPEFPFDFCTETGEEVLINPSFNDSNFIMTIYGFAENPQLNIAGHPYKVEATINEGEQLVINSLTHTVQKIGRLGENTNLYNARGKIYSVFKKIPPGTNTLQWSGGFGVDIKLFDERSEPKCSL